MIMAPHFSSGKKSNVGGGSLAWNVTVNAKNLIHYEYLREYDLNTMGDDDTNQKKRKPKWITSYSKMSIRETEKRLGIRIDELRAVPVDQMLANAKHILKGTDTIKEKVYDRIVEYLEIEGYPTEASADFKEAKVSDLVLYIIGPILSDFWRKTGRKIRLEREKEIISTDNETGGIEEFVVMDRISVTEEKFVLVIEAKRSSLGEAMKQCLLSLNDARDNNSGGEVYGFITTGKSWRMVKYDGRDFCQTREIHSLFEGMDQERELWMKDYSDLVDCMYFALGNGDK
ncbi:hypothetical protein BDD12DRAFT_809376 [Trichophaea hybrida]|nr:hypothetical protein BDD12DRAFT_809376 [Trichophaea hybrida]